MRSLLLLTLSAGAALCADFTTGQAARLVIGQPNFAAQKSDAKADILGGAGGVAYANDMLFVTDANRVGASPINHRVLVYKGLASILPAPTDELVYDRACPACLGTATLVLGQQEFSKTDPALTQTGMRLPTAVASDGTMLAVADTDNNRVLIWRQIPDANGAPADVVLGQPDFTSNAVPKAPTASSFRGPQGVWFQGGKLFVADTGNHRILVWNSIPAANAQAADVVLGQPDFTTFVETDLTRADVKASASVLLNPVSVTSDGVRLYVADLAFNRVLIWNSIPTRNQQPADVVLGQPDMESLFANYSSKLCTSTGTDANGNNTYPGRCNATLSFPRYALSDGQRLFIADGGNDRVLVYSSVPTQNGQGADIVLGQYSDTLNSSSDSADPLRRSSADSVRTPLSLAWDGTNLFVTDPFNRRVMVFTLAERSIPFTGVRNAASFQVFAVGAITFSGTVKENDEAIITIADKEYKYKIVAGDTFDTVIAKIVTLINEGEGDPNVFASPNLTLAAIILTARKEGSAGDAVGYSSTTNAGAQIVVRTTGSRLDGGGDAARIAPGTLITIVGDNLADQTAVGETNAEGWLPLKLGGVRVYFNGIHAPLLYVSPKQINAQLPFEALADAQNCDSVASTFEPSQCQNWNAYVRTEWSDGRVTITNPVAVSIIPQNPGVFTYGGSDPRPAVTLHFSSFATGTVSVDGSVAAGDTPTVNIEDRSYAYTVKADDTLVTIRDGLITLINADPKVHAFPAGQFTRIRLQAREEGQAGIGIKYSVSTNSGAKVILSPTSEALCCANVAGSLVTAENPLAPGETFILYATGLGLIEPKEAKDLIATGQAYKGPELNKPVEFVSALCGSKTANVLYAGLKPGWVGVYEIHLELNSDIPTNPRTQCTIAQDIYVSNITTIPVVNPTPAP